ncbi:GTP-binding protein rho1-like protein [Infundibulicybe gibba]|nr:GTP-binding protein rho1-like protein [Infundibulicybe gibba]
MHSTSKHDFRISVIGDGAVGKTWLLSIFAGIETWIPTACENRRCHVTLDGVHVTLTLCDTSGQEYYDKLRILTYLKSDVILLLDCEVKQYYPTTPIILVGCKADLRQDQKLQWSDDSSSKGMALAQKISAEQYCECSAETGEGIDEVFEYATREALNAQTQDTRWTCIIS